MESLFSTLGSNLVGLLDPAATSRLSRVSQFFNKFVQSHRQRIRRPDVTLYFYEKTSKKLGEDSALRFRQSYATDIVEVLFTDGSRSSASSPKQTIFENNKGKVTLGLRGSVCARATFIEIQLFNLTSSEALPHVFNSLNLEEIQSEAVLECGALSSEHLTAFLQICQQKSLRYRRINLLDGAQPLDEITDRLSLPRRHYYLLSANETVPSEFLQLVKECQAECLELRFFEGDLPSNFFNEIASVRSFIHTSVASFANTLKISDEQLLKWNPDHFSCHGETSLSPQGVFQWTMSSNRQPSHRLYFSVSARDRTAFMEHFRQFAREWEVNNQLSSRRGICQGQAKMGPFYFIVNTIDSSGASAIEIRFQLSTFPDIP